MKRMMWIVALMVVTLPVSSASADFYVVGGGGGLGTRITSLPYTIITPGFYYLAGNLTLPANNSISSAIFVAADNVTIDLMGFNLACSGYSDYTSGIDIGSRKNVEVRNGTVSGFPVSGIYDALAGYNYRIINVRLEKNGSGILLAWGGYYHLIKNCTISENGSHGIIVSAKGSMITDNVVSKNAQRGIHCTGEGSSLVGNVVVDNGDYGFFLNLNASVPYLVDRNTAYNNTAGNLNGIPPDAKFGLNAGPGFP
jgi:hypothetical protein